VSGLGTYLHRYVVYVLVRRGTESLRDREGNLSSTSL